MNGRLKDQAIESKECVQHLIDEHNALLKAKVDQGVQKSKEVRVGAAGQYWAPYFTDFDYNTADARFIGGPIDFVIFDGYTEWLDGKKDSQLKIVLAEVKSAKSGLTDGQRMIKKAIDKGEVKLAFYTYKLPKSVQEVKEDRIPLSLDDMVEEDEGG